MAQLIPLPIVAAILLVIIARCDAEFHSSVLETSNRSEGDKIILTAHGMGINDVNRVVIPVSNGIIPPLPCVTSNAGTHEHGATFTRNNFHYSCNNGTAEVVACIADDGSVIQLGRTFVRSGMKHFCNVEGENVTYKQESMCFENGMHYNIGDSFRNGSFKLTCKEQGIHVEGCYMQNSFSELLQAGESRIENGKRHECEIIGMGKVRYVVKMLGCTHQGQQYNVGQMWTHQHVRYQCKNDGSLNVLGCIDDGLFIELGRDLLMNGMAHRCYQVNTTTFYHKQRSGPATNCPYHVTLRDADISRRMRLKYRSGLETLQKRTLVPPNTCASKHLSLQTQGLPSKFACEKSSLAQCVSQNMQRRAKRHL